ncbi:MAG: DUF4339 domain-containing protein [Akkermansiaceae bacterium]|nr:DUF4339 domain-containing protein [Akkermansiaceae bacterium]
MSDIQYWHYLDTAGQQQGPITADQLQQLAATGQITAQTNVWTEGMAEWLPATQVEGLIPAQPVVAQPVVVPQAQPVVAQAVNPYAPSVATQAAVPQQGGNYPIPLVNKVSFGLYAGCLIGGFVLYLIAMIQIAASSPTAEEMANNPNALDNGGGIGLGMLLLVVGMIALLVGAVIQFIAIYRIWSILRPGGGTVSPGSAVGFLFIPFFGPIWMIIILCKLPGEWNGIVARYQNTATAPRLSIGIAICAILIPVIGQLLWMKEVTKAINFMVMARIMPQPQAGQTQPGGLKLY